MWQLSSSYVACGITTGLIAAHFVPLAIDRGVSPGLAATIFGLMAGLNVLGGIVAGILSDRFRRKDNGSPKISNANILVACVDKLESG